MKLSKRKANEPNLPRNISPPMGLPGAGPLTAADRPFVGSNQMEAYLNLCFPFWFVYWPCSRGEHPVHFQRKNEGRETKSSHRFNLLQGNPRIFHRSLQQGKIVQTQGGGENIPFLVYCHYYNSYNICNTKSRLKTQKIITPGRKPRTER